MDFPLPLAPFEEYMLLDDRAAYPMDCAVRLRCSGQVDEQSLQTAFATVLKRHPLFTSRVAKSKRGRWEWVADELSVAVIRWYDKRTEKGYPQLSDIKLQEESGLRLWVARSESTELVVQWHHACADGAGAFLFIGELLVAYAGAVERRLHEVSLPPLDEERLKRRAKYGTTTLALLAMSHKQAVGLFGAAQFFFRKAAPIIPHEPCAFDSPLPPEFPQAHTFELVKEETDAFGAAAKRQGATTNDLLCRDLFLALGDWRAKWSPGDPRDWLRLSVPKNMRTPEDHRLPAANVVSLVFLDRREPMFADPTKLLQSIHWEMQFIKRLQLGFTFVLMQRLFRRLPGGLARMARGDRCAATCLISNVGDALASTPLPKRDDRVVAGNLVVEGLDIVGPCRPYTAVAIVLFRYAGRLGGTMHIDTRALLTEQGQDLFDMYVHRLRESAGSAAVNNADATLMQQNSTAGA